MAKSKGYRWFNHLDYLAQPGQVFDTRMGWQFYIVGVGSSIFEGTFKFKVWIEKGTANEYISPVPPKEDPEPPKKEEPVANTTLPVPVNITTP